MPEPVHAMEAPWSSDDTFSRTRMLIGSEGLARLTQAHVVVAGLGAVGSYAVEGRARAGVGSLRLVDFDTIEPSNLNRQLYALHSTLGMPKVTVAAARVADIHPDCAVEALGLFADATTLGEVLAPPVDLVVDAIDSLDAKLELVAATLRSGVPICSSMGAALRFDPSRVRIAQLSETSVCPVARRLRRGLAALGLPAEEVRCVFSDEPPRAPREEPPERPGRRPPLGSLATVTGVFGLTLAHLALETLLGENWGATPAG